MAFFQNTVNDIMYGDGWRHIFCRLVYMSLVVLWFVNHGKYLGGKLGQPAQWKYKNSVGILQFIGV